MLKKPLSSIPFSKRGQRHLPQNEIDIWSFVLDGPLPPHYHAVLDPKEQKRANQFYFPHHRHHFARGRALLRYTLGYYLNKPPQNLIFGYGKHDKPYLKDYPELTFNLSHSGNQALLAIGQTLPVGIDIEQFSGRPYTGIGGQVFSSTENQALAHLPEHLKPMMFFNTWAQKEAFIKQIGMGLAYPTEKLTVQTLAKAAYTLTCPIYQKTCKILPFMLQIGYASALCYDPLVETIHLSKLAEYPESI